MTLAGMPSINGRGIAIGVGSYDGESAFAIGFQIQAEQASFQIGVTSSGGETGASAGVGFQAARAWARLNRSRAARARARAAATPGPPRWPARSARGRYSRGSANSACARPHRAGSAALPSSMERWCSAARTRRRVFTSSSRLRIVMLAMVMPSVCPEAQSTHRLRCDQDSRSHDCIRAECLQRANAWPATRAFAAPATSNLPRPGSRWAIRRPENRANRSRSPASNSLSEASVRVPNPATLLMEPGRKSSEKGSPGTGRAPLTRRRPHWPAGPPEYPCGQNHRP